MLEILIFAGAIIFAIPFNFLIYRRIMFSYIPLISFLFYVLLVNTVSRYLLALNFSWAPIFVAIFALWFVWGKIDRHLAVM